MMFTHKFIKNNSIKMSVMNKIIALLVKYVNVNCLNNNNKNMHEQSNWCKFQVLISLTTGIKIEIYFCFAWIETATKHWPMT